MVHGPVREVVRGPSPLDWSTDRGSVFSSHPFFPCHSTVALGRTTFDRMRVPEFRPPKISFSSLTDLLSHSCTVTLTCSALPESKQFNSTSRSGQGWAGVFCRTQNDGQRYRV